MIQEGVLSGNNANSFTSLIDSKEKDQSTKATRQDVQKREPVFTMASALLIDVLDEHHKASLIITNHW